jgi:Icc-related predicted phosphoesterase
VKVALTSDTHGRLPIVEGVDAIIHAGDIGPDIDAINWFKHLLYPWAKRMRVPVYVTPGNHDRIVERFNVPSEGKPSNLHLRIDTLEHIFGVKVWFSPWSPIFFDWAYMADEDKLAKKYAKIPDDTQVIVSHSPPFGYGDLNQQKIRCGSGALLYRMGQLSDLRLVVCGHIHEAFGSYNYNGIDVFNVSFMDAGYRPKNKPVIIEWPPKEREQHGADHSE